MSTPTFSEQRDHATVPNDEEEDPIICLMDGSDDEASRRATRHRIHLPSQSSEEGMRARWRSAPREGGGRTDGSSLAGALEYATEDVEEAREKRMGEAGEQEQIQTVPDLLDMEPFPGASIPLY